MSNFLMISYEFFEISSKSEYNSDENFLYFLDSSEHEKSQNDQAKCVGLCTLLIVIILCMYFF